MSYRQPLSSHQKAEHQPGRSSPLRYTTSNASNASTNSSIYSSTSSNPFLPSRTSTMSSTASSAYQQYGLGHKRGISETSPTRPSAREDRSRPDTTAAEGYKSLRQTLRPLPQAPNPSPPAPVNKPYLSQPVEAPKYHYDGPAYSPTVNISHQEKRGSLLSRAGSVTPMSSASHRAGQHNHSSPHGSTTLTTPDLTTLQKSSTGHLRNLSRFAQNSSSEDFSISSPAPSVIGLSGRRQLKRTGSTRASKSNGAGGMARSSAWSENNWMEKQRQFLQAYEYLCHIGEAKEWIEDVIHNTLPPIVQLEEALRDGVTLAEIVQAFYPDQQIRIFRHHRLQFRHSDNIALFFQFLADMELPELFRFELIDLYEKKNIPKVIYCIHALSWLLFRKGIVDFRIGNLVGQLEFEHHELEAMQKGLDKAGVSMPSFAGMGASFGAEPVPEPEPEPEPEPVETEEERVTRELESHEAMVMDLQSQVRGALIRLSLGDKMQALWDAEESIVDFQAVIRGKWAREVADYRLGMKRFATELQSVSRGFIVRTSQRGREQWWRGREGEVIGLQSLVRAQKVRRNIKEITILAGREHSGIRIVQAAIRGALRRKQVDDQLMESEHASTTVHELQAAVRGMLQRQRKKDDQSRLQASEGSIAWLQAAARATAQRQKITDQRRALRAMSDAWQNLHSGARGHLCRLRIESTRRELEVQQQSISAAQAIIRGRRSRNAMSWTRHLLTESESEVVLLQAASRAYLCRKQQDADNQGLEKQTSGITQLQAHLRGLVARNTYIELHESLDMHMPEVIQLQSLSRAMRLRMDVGGLLAQLEDEEPMIAEFQAAIRAKLLREKFAEKQRFFRANMEKVVKVQSFVRGKLQGEAYKSLTSGANPPVGTVKGFVHLLNDSDFDFDEEVEFERLRKTVVQHVRQNEMADQYITQLDIKIALLVKNKITLDEVVKHQKHFGGAAGSLLTNTEIASKDPFDLKALNKNSRRKLQHYQELFFILQTQPQYLARLFRRMREQAMAEKECERIKHLMMGLFGYAQKRREEYYLMKLITRSLREEVDHCQSIQDYLRGNFFWAKLFGAYVKSPRDRKYMRDLLAPIVKDNIIDNPELDLESDPMQIYLSAIENEQLRTGQRSQRSPDIPREAAIRDPETKRTFIAHLQDLRDIADQFFAALEDHLPRMPFGVRYIAQQMFHTLTARFPHDERGHLLQIVGHWVWKCYLLPALTEPEKYGVIDRGLLQEHKRNIGEVSKVVGQVAAAKLFGGENVFLQPLNSYVGESIERLGDIWSNLIDVPDAEAQFDIDEFNDLYSRTKPTLYIKMADIFSIHHLVAAETASLCPNRDDMLQEVIHELGSAKNNESELMGVSSSEICLTLNPKLHEAEDPDAEVKALFMETKRCILYVIRVQSGGDLMEIMVKPITMEDEDRWEMLVREEMSAGSRNRGAYTEANTMMDIGSMSYAELKRTALENILRLEQYGRLTRHNHYQDLLNAISVDIRTKHRRRIQRQRELETVRLTLARLNDQAIYLEGQLKTYNDYIEQAMVTLQNKKGKKRFLMPFTKQWDHERELQRSGRVPKFGSFKYSAQELANRGILVSWAGYSERQWDKIDLTISSNEVGIFCIDGSNGPIAMPGASAQVPLDDLLQAQFNNTQFLEFFPDCKVRVNVNLFLHLIMRKFYKDKDS